MFENEKLKSKLFSGEFGRENNEIFLKATILEEKGFSLSYVSLNILLISYIDCREEFEIITVKQHPYLFHL